MAHSSSPNSLAPYLVKGFMFSMDRITVNAAGHVVLMEISSPMQFTNFILRCFQEA